MRYILTEKDQRQKEYHLSKDRPTVPCMKLNLQKIVTIILKNCRIFMKVFFQEQIN